MSFKAIPIFLKVCVFIFLITVPPMLLAAEDVFRNPHEQVVIENVEGQQHIFDLEIATTSQQRERGLMFRRTMPKDSGMMFVFKSPEIAHFWMKNTYIPLDILFIRADGSIGKIIHAAKPLDLKYLSSDEPVVAAIELNGGEATRRGIKAGDKVKMKK